MGKYQQKGPRMFPGPFLFIRSESYSLFSSILLVETLALRLAFWLVRFIA